MPANHVRLFRTLTYFGFIRKYPDSIHGSTFIINYELPSIVFLINRTLASIDKIAASDNSFHWRSS